MSVAEPPKLWFFIYKISRKSNGNLQNFEDFQELSEYFYFKANFTINNNKGGGFGVQEILHNSTKRKETESLRVCSKNRL